MTSSLLSRLGASARRRVARAGVDGAVDDARAPRARLARASARAGAARAIRAVAMRVVECGRTRRARAMDAARSARARWTRVAATTRARTRARATTRAAATRTSTRAQIFRFANSTPRETRETRETRARAGATTAPRDLDSDATPELTRTERACACAAAAAAGAAASAARAATPPLATVAVAIAAYAVARAVFVERRYAEALVSPREAADADGEFLDVDGVEVHYKRARRANAKRFIECMHGFGANASSWTTSDTMRRASEALDAEVVAHDSCGFGLTARPRDVKKYTRASDAKACRAIAREVGGDAAARSLTLMGHSLGAVGAALAAAQGGVDYVVLVAPAIIGGKLRKNDAGDDAALSLPTFVRVAFAAVGAAAATAAWCLTCAVKPFLILLLRKLVRSKEFWTKGLRAAIDPSRVDAMASDWIDGYRKPSVVRDWDVGMFRVVLASVVAASSPREIWRDAMARARATTQPSTLEREDAVNALVESGAKILIVHGENDVIVPASNSRTLAKLLNCELRILPKCGHMPHEESPEAFIDVLRDFIS